MEQSISGFEVTGGWADVVSHGEHITSALEKVGADETYPNEFEDWDEWRPKLEEQLSVDVNEKTAEKASMNEGVGEENNEKVTDNLKEANTELKQTVKNIKEKKEPEDVFESWKQAVQQTGHAADTTSRTVIRRIEQTVYQNVMTAIAPYYFDNALVSANIKKNRDDSYTFEVNVNDDQLKSEVQDVFNSYDSQQEMDTDLLKHEYEPSDRVKHIEGLE